MLKNVAVTFCGFWLVAPWVLGMILYTAIGYAAYRAENFPVLFILAGFGLTGAWSFGFVWYTTQQAIREETVETTVFECPLDDNDSQDPAI